MIWGVHGCICLYFLVCMICHHVAGMHVYMYDRMWMATVNVCVLQIPVYCEIIHTYTCHRSRSCKSIHNLYHKFLFDLVSLLTLSRFLFIHSGRHGTYSDLHYGSVTIYNPCKQKYTVSLECSLWTSWRWCTLGNNKCLFSRWSILADFVWKLCIFGNACWGPVLSWISRSTITWYHLLDCYLCNNIITYCITDYCQMTKECQ